ncbi:MAG TPA: SDR family oxidoreductase [Acidimicrobiales bacterium]|nr:SDR family oxidoreductase [Acidimicrobiales bacterium]
MSGRTAVVTGGNAGIGKAAAEGLARLGARVVITSRNPERGREAVDDIRRASGSDSVESVHLDLASLASVRGCAKELTERLDTIHILDLNAGGVLSRRQVTEDGLEMQFQVNHLGHFLLTHLLLDRLRQSAPARVVVVSSASHTQARRGLDFDDLQWERRPYRGMTVYGATKLMNLYFTFELARRLKGSGITANALHPGFVGTEFGHGGDTRWLTLGIRIARPFARSPGKGAQTAVWLGASPDVEGETGKYFFDCREKEPSTATRDVGAARRLWEISQSLVGTT